MSESPLVSRDELDEVFVNWEELVTASSYFNKALRVRQANSVNGQVVMIGDVLCQQIRGLTPYMRFCSVQLRGSALLGERSGEGGAWQELLRQCQEHPSVRGHTLTGFLLKPMQRVTRYPLLISKLLSRTARGHPDHHNTVEALAESKTLCQQVNEAVAERDNTEKLEWLQKNVRLTDLPERLVFNSLTNFKQQRKLLYMGLLHKSKSGREVLVFLLSDFLLLCIAQRSLAACSTSLAALSRALSTTAATLYKKPMLLEQLAAVRSEHKDNELELIYCNGEEVVSMVTSSSTERDNWLHKVTEAQRALRDARSTLFSRQQSVRKRAPKGVVILHIIKGHLTGLDKGEKTESFCEVSLGSQVRETDPASGHKPHWDSSMQFYVKSVSDDRLCITVMLKGYFRPNDYIGRAELLVQRLWEKQRQHQHPVPHVIKVALQETGAKDAYIVVKYSLILFERKHSKHF